MIRTEQEYEHGRSLLEDFRRTILEQEASYRSEGKPEDAVQRLIDPNRACAAGIADEIDQYERWRRGELGMFADIPVEHADTMLRTACIAFRIARGLTQADLAQRLGVSEQDVARDERHEYFGASYAQLMRVLMVIDSSLQISIHACLSAGDRGCASP